MEEERKPRAGRSQPRPQTPGRGPGSGAGAGDGPGTAGARGGEAGPGPRGGRCGPGRDGRGRGRGRPGRRAAGPGQVAAAGAGGVEPHRGTHAARRPRARRDPRTALPRPARSPAQGHPLLALTQPGPPGPEQAPTAGGAAGPGRLCGRSPGSELELPTGGQAGAAPAHARSRSRARRPAPGFKGDAGPAREGPGAERGERLGSQVVVVGSEGRETEGEGREGSSCGGEENFGSWGRAPKRKGQALPMRPFPRSQGAQLKFQLESGALCSPRPCKAPTGSRSQRPRRAGLPVAPGIKHQQAWERCLELPWGENKFPFYWLGNDLRVPPGPDLTVWSHTGAGRG